MSGLGRPFLVEAHRGRPHENGTTAAPSNAGLGCPAGWDELVRPDLTARSRRFSARIGPITTAVRSSPRERYRKSSIMSALTRREGLYGTGDPTSGTTPVFSGIGCNTGACVIAKTRFTPGMRGS